LRRLLTIVFTVTLLCGAARADEGGTQNPPLDEGGTQNPPVTQSQDEGGTQNPPLALLLVMLFNLNSNLP
jgi:hypothetical protein